MEKPVTEQLIQAMKLSGMDEMSMSKQVGEHTMYITIAKTPEEEEESE